MRLQAGQTALITGSSRGLGVEIATRLAERGLDLILAARSADALARVADEIRGATGRSVRVHAVDMADSDAVARLAAAAQNVDVLVNNAGIEGACRFHERTVSEITQTIAVNLTGPMLLTHALLPEMIRRGHGHIVNIASVAGLAAVPFNEPYSATKAGLIGFTRSLRLTAQACGWAVSASVVCPGFIEGDGMFEALKTNHGVSPEGMEAAPIDRVGAAVIEAIENDLPDVIVAGVDMRPYAIFSVADPSAFEAASAESPVTAMFRDVADARSRRS